MSDHQRGRGSSRGSGQSRGGGPSRGGGGPSRGGSGDGSSGNIHRGGVRGGSFRGQHGRGGPRGSDVRGGFRGRGDTFQIPDRTGAGRPAAGIYLENVPISQPDENVTKAENDRVKQTRHQLIDGFPGRPGHGTQGKKIILRANNLPLQTAFETGNAEIPLHRYAVSFAESLSKPKKRLMLQNIVKLDMFKNMQWATDFSGLIVTTKVLKLGPGNSFQGKLELLEVNERPMPSSPTDSAAIHDAIKRRTKQFKIEPNGSFSLSHLVNALRSNAPGSYFGAKEEAIQLLNIIIARAPNAAANVYAFAGNKFYPDGHPLTEEMDLGDGLRAMRGYYASVRTSTRRILLNLNVCSAAFYKPIPLRNIMNEVLGNDRVPRSPNDLKRLETFLHHLRVETRYLKARGGSGTVVTKARTIHGFALLPSPPPRRYGDAKTVRFTIQSTGKQITIFDYFRQEHGITLKFSNEPVLNVGSKNDPSYLPVELCTVMPGQAVRRFLTGPQTAAMITFAARAPNQNALPIAGTTAQPGAALQLLGLNAEAQSRTTQPFGFRVTPEMITVLGRILQSPKVQYSAGAPTVPRFASWNLANQKFKKPGTFQKWSCLILDEEGPRGKALQSENLVTRQGDTIFAPEDLIREFEKHLRGYGMSMGQRQPTRNVTIKPPRLENREKINEALEMRFSGASANGIEILLIVLREADKWLYSRIKFYGDIKYGVQTVCVVGSKFQKPKGQGMYFGNIALKFNIKGGGIAHIIPIKEMSPLDNRTMVVGIDVTHPSPGSKEGAPSIAGVVASIDSHLCQWPGSLRSQTGRVEMVDGLTAMMIERLELWRKKNQGNLPDKIIVYRDGVSEGQYRTVLEVELPSIQGAFERLYGEEENWPKVSIIIVGKRHHTRFYPTRKEDADTRSWNPQPGTVVDRGVTDHFLWDFFLQAHAGLQGTARPAHYVVIMDQIGFEQDQLEQLTHKMCYLFNRATKAVSICPPAYYADLICERGRAYLYSVLNEEHADDSSSVHSASIAEWTEGVHENLTEKTFYI